MAGQSHPGKAAGADHKEAPALPTRISDWDHQAQSASIGSSTQPAVTAWSKGLRPRTLDQGNRPAHANCVALRPVLALTPPADGAMAGGV